jgi:hypothetical protein
LPDLPLALPLGFLPGCPGMGRRGRCSQGGQRSSAEAEERSAARHGGTGTVGQNGKRRFAHGPSFVASETMDAWV